MTAPKKRNGRKRSEMEKQSEKVMVRFTKAEMRDLKRVAGRVPLARWLHDAGVRSVRSALARQKRAKE